jgi:anti-sigma-K factor RskA
MTEHDDHLVWSDDLAAYALGALEPHEAAAFEGHLVSCHRCRAELARLAPAIDRLPASVAPVEPPPDLRRRIMDVVETDAAAQHAAPGPLPTPSRRRRPMGDRWRWALRPAPVAALAATVAVAFFAGFALRGGGDDPRRTTVPAQALASVPVRAALVERDGTWQLEVDRLPALPPNRVYEVWVRDASGVRPSSLFVLSRDGRARVPLPDALDRGDEVLVTREPAGGSATPTSAPLLRAVV